MPALKWVTAIVSAFDLAAGILLVMLKTRARLKDGNCECAKRFCATKPGTKCSLFVTTRICFRVTAFFGWIFLFVFEAHILNLVETLRDAHCVDITDARHNALNAAVRKDHSLTIFVAKCVIVAVEICKDALFFTHALDHDMIPTHNQNRKEYYQKIIAMALFDIVLFCCDVVILASECGQILELQELVQHALQIDHGWCGFCDNEH